MSEGSGEEPAASHPPDWPSDAPGGPGPESASELAEQAPEEIVEEPPLTVSGDVDRQEPKTRPRRTVDDTRAGLAWALVAIFGGTVGAVILVVALNGHSPAAEVTELLKTLVPAETALLGSAVGFYFGIRTRP